MYGSLRTAGLRTLMNYEQAKSAYENIKPIRGNTNDIRPLGERRKTHMRIEKDGDIYYATLYKTRCIAYHPDGLITLSCGGWETNSTVAFMAAVSPFNVYQKSGAWVGIYNEGHYRMPSAERLQTKNGVVLNPVQLFKTSYNPETTKKLRAHIKPLLDWWKITAALMKDSEGRVWLGETKALGVYGYFARGRLPDDPTDFFSCLAALCGKRVWASLSSGYYVCAPSARTALVKALYHNAVNLGLCTEEELFVSTPVPLGQHFRQLSL